MTSSFNISRESNHTNWLESTTIQFHPVVYRRLPVRVESRNGGSEAFGAPAFASLLMILVAKFLCCHRVVSQVVRYLRFVFARELENNGRLRFPS